MHEREPQAGPDPVGCEPRGPNEQPTDGYEIDRRGRIEHTERLPDDSRGDEPGSGEHATAARPRIWVGSWLDYNNGILHGDWISADQDDAEVWTDIQAMLARSPTSAQTGVAAEDWGIFDHEHFGPLRIHENESVAWVATVARGIAEHGLAFAAWADVMQDEALLDGFEIAYLGHFDSVEAFAEQLVDDLGYQQVLDDAVPEQLQPYIRIDCSALARDLQAGGDIHVVPANDGGVWLFDA